MTSRAFDELLLARMTDDELVRLARTIECGPLTRELADRLAMAGELTGRLAGTIVSLQERRRRGRPIGTRAYELTPRGPMRRPTCQELALGILPNVGDSLSSYELTRRLAEKANTSINAAGNAIRGLVSSGLFSAEGRGKKKVITRAAA